MSEYTLLDIKRPQRQEPDLSEMTLLGINMPSEPVKEEKSGVITELGRGLIEGVAGMGETAGTLMKIASGDEGKAGKWLEEKSRTFADKFRMPEELQGSVVDRPELLLEPRWWAHGIGQVAGSMVAPVGVGGTAAKGASVVFKKILANPKNIARATKYTGIGAAGATGGAMEGTQTYNSVLEETGDENRALKAGSLMALGSAALNSLSFGKMLSQKTKSKIAHVIASGVTEGATEQAEEPWEAIVSGHPEQAVDAWIDGFNVFFPSLIVGGLGGAGGAQLSKNTLTNDEMVEVKNAIKETSQEEDLSPEEKEYVDWWLSEIEKAEAEKGPMEEWASTTPRWVTEAEAEAEAEHLEAQRDLGQGKLRDRLAMEEEMYGRDYPALPKPDIIYQEGEAEPQRMIGQRKVPMIENKTLALPKPEAIHLPDQSVLNLPDMSVSDILSKREQILQHSDMTPDDLNQLIIDKQSRKFETGEIEKPETAMRSEATRLGLEYVGIQEGVRGSLHLFTDPQNGSTFAVPEGESVDAALRGNRERFAPKTPVGETGDTTVQPKGEEATGGGKEQATGVLGGEKEPLVIDQEDYLAQYGASRLGIGESALHKNIPEGKQRKRLLDNQAKKDWELLKKRERLGSEYREKVEKGEIRPPTRTEKLIDTARGHPDNESTQAARRILEKRGIDWVERDAAAKEKEPWQMTRDEAIWGNYIPSGMNTERALKAQVKLWQKRYDSFSDSEKATLLPDNGIVAGLMRAKEHLDKANAHRDAVAKALSENKPVPPEVLKDYPELTQKPHDNIPDVSVQKKVTKPSATESAKLVANDKHPWFAAKEAREVGSRAEAPLASVQGEGMEAKGGVPQAIEVDGLKIYPTTIKGESRWAVQSPGNKGTDKFHGDTLHATQQEAMDYAKVVARQEADKINRENAQSAAKEAEQRKKNEIDSDDIRGFVSDKSPMHKGSVRKTLDKKYNFGDDGIMTVRQRVEKLYDDGNLKLSTFEESKIKPMSRSQYNRASNAEQQAHERKMKDAGSKTVYLVNGSDLGKTAYDYAEHLSRHDLTPQPSGKAEQSFTKGEQSESVNREPVNQPSSKETKAQPESTQKKTKPGYVWIKEKQRPFTTYREILRGKNKGMYRVSVGGKGYLVDKGKIARFPEGALGAETASPTAKREPVSQKPKPVTESRQKKTPDLTATFPSSYSKTPREVLGKNSLWKVVSKDGKVVETEYATHPHIFIVMDKKDRDAIGYQGKTPQGRDAVVSKEVVDSQLKSFKKRGTEVKTIEIAKYAERDDWGILSDGNIEVAVNPKLIGMVKRQHPNATFYLNGPERPITAFDGKEWKALIMPMSGTNFESVRKDAETIIEVPASAKVGKASSPPRPQGATVPKKQNVITGTIREKVDEAIKKAPEIDSDDLLRLDEIRDFKPSKWESNDAGKKRGAENREFYDSLKEKYGTIEITSPTGQGWKYNIINTKHHLGNFKKQIEKLEKGKEGIALFRKKAKAEKAVTEISVDSETLTKGILSRMNRTLKSMGYDVRGADDIKMLLDRRMLRNGKLWHEDWIRAYQQAIEGAELAKARKAQKSERKHIDRSRLRELGYTNDPREAGYITPIGKLIDLSGKREGGQPGTRSYDHREAGGTLGMQEFMDEGSIRMDYRAGSFDIVAMPTSAQLKIVRKIAAEKNGEITLDLWEGLGEQRESYYLEPSRVLSVQYREGTKPSKIINDIKTFYAGEMPSKTLFRKSDPTNTPAFKEWFGNSKVVDENGKPLVVYHGTPTGGFVEFKKKGLRDTGWLGAGFYFTSNEVQAKSFTAPRMRDRKKGRPEVYGVYLAIKNPLIVSELTGDQVVDMVNINRKANGKPQDYSINKLSDQIAVSLYHKDKREWGQLDSDERSVVLKDLGDPSRMAETAGYDGIISGDMENSIVAFSPTQIKSINNQGTFDPENPNILMRKGKPSGIPIPAVNRSIDPILSKWKGAPKIVVTNSKDTKIPKGLMRQMGDAEGVAGAFYEDTVYLFHDNIDSIDDAQKTILHESAHWGPRRMFGRSFDRFLRGVLRSADKGVLDRVAKLYECDMTKVPDRMLAAEEYVAHISETGQDAKTWNRFTSYVKQWLIKRGFTVKLSDDEIRAIVSRGREGTGTVFTKDGRMRTAAFHGSPHTFDKFSTEKIGTGEGAQAYGHGLYFAGAKEVAEFYRDTLSKGELLTVKRNGKIIAQGDTVSDDLLDAYKFIEMGRKQAQYPHLVAYTAKHEADRAASGLPGAQAKNERVKKLIDEYADAQFSYERPPSHLYEVELAPEEDEYLLWDKPLSEQSEKVKGALGKHAKKPKYTIVENKYGRYEVQDQFGNTVGNQDDFAANLEGALEFYNANPKYMNAARLYEKLSKFKKSDKAASEYLHSLGIRGIKYLDATSRGKGEGAYNYVIFSDEDVEIKARFRKKEKGGSAKFRRVTDAVPEASIETDEQANKFTDAIENWLATAKIPFISHTRKDIENLGSTRDLPLAKRLDNMGLKGIQRKNIISKLVSDITGEKLENVTLDELTPKGKALVHNFLDNVQLDPYGKAIIEEVENHHGVKLTKKFVDGVDDFRDLNKAHIFTLQPYRAADFVDPSGELYKQTVIPAEDANHKIREEFDGLQKKLRELMPGAKKGSRVSAMLQDYAEGRLDLGKIPERWRGHIRETSVWARKIYDENLERVNKARVQAGKSEIKRRDDYFTHGAELSFLTEFFGGAHKIPNEVAKISHLTHPNSPYFKYEFRKGGEFNSDGIGNFLAWNDNALKTIYNTPVLLNARAYIKHLPPNAFRYFTSWSDEVLAGKTSPIDKAIPAPLLKGWTWLRHRMVKNIIIGSARIAVQQPSTFAVTFAELATGRASTLGDVARNIQDTFWAFGHSFTKAGQDFCAKHSREYRDRMYIEEFDPTMLNSLEYKVQFINMKLDQIMVGQAFLGKARQLIRQGMDPEEAYIEADKAAKKTNASYQKINLPPILRANMGKNLLPVQTFTFNFMHYAGMDTLGLKNTRGKKVALAKGLTLMAACMAINELYEGLHMRPTWDFMSLIPGLGYLKYGVSGPLGVIHSMYKYAAGDQSGTSFGKAIEKAAWQIAPPFGGEQIRKSIDGYKTITNPDEKPYKINNDWDRLMAVVFGPGSSMQAVEYWEARNNSPLKKLMDGANKKHSRTQRRSRRTRQDRR